MKTSDPQEQKNQDSLPEPVEALSQPVPVQEIGGVKGPEPTRYGDWEKNGRCIDF